MIRHAVKLLLLDADDNLLLIHAQDPVSKTECWYPVGGGVHPGESLYEAAVREAYEETGLNDLRPGQQVWQRDHTYEFAGRSVAVHEDWTLHRVDHFEPTPTALTDNEAQIILGYRWWTHTELAHSTETIYPPELAQLVKRLVAGG